MVRGNLNRVVETLLTTDGARSVTQYLTPTTVVRASVVRYKNKVGNRVVKPYKGQHTTLVVTIGGPNYREKDFIKLCKKAGVKFPVSKLQIRYGRTK